MSSRKQKRYRKSPSFVGKIRMAKLLLQLEWSAEADSDFGDAPPIPACPACFGLKPGEERGPRFGPEAYGHREACEMGKVAEALRSIKGLAAA
jgi:hypothetical protein